MPSQTQPGESATSATTTRRCRLPAMYTLLRLRGVGEPRYRWTGHIYDIGLDGMRFEIDHALPSGMRLELRAMLPGEHQVLIHATGKVIRIDEQEDDEPAVCAPVRMGLRFERFQSPADRQRLEQYLRAIDTQKAEKSKTSRQAA